MDYDIKLDKLEAKQSEFENLKSNIEDIYNEFNSSYLNNLSSELNSLKSKLKENITRLKKGYTNSNNWFKKYLKELTDLENEIATFKNNSLDKPIEFKGEFIDMFGKKTMPILKTGAETKSLSGTLGAVKGTNLLLYEYNGKKFYIPDTKIPLDNYSAYIIKNKMYQNAGFQGGQCMLLSQYYASDMLRGEFTSKSVMDNHGGSPAVKMNERCKSINEQDVLDYAYQEINSGNPVVLQVTQKNSNKGARHLVTMVGYTSDVTSSKDLTPDKILVLDCVDGKIQTLDERNRRLFNQGGEFQALGPTEEFLSTVA